MLAAADRIPAIRAWLGALHPYALTTNALLARMAEQRAAELALLTGSATKTETAPTTGRLHREENDDDE